MTPEYIASQFESLGGGGLRPGWAFGCEFGFWQRSLRVEPMGLLRWASITPADLQRGLECRFSGVDDPSSIVARDAGPLWAITQMTYGIHLDHTGMMRSEVSREEVAKRMALNLGFLRRKLVEDIAAGDKIFVYRTYDHTMRDGAVAALADALGDSTLLYVRIAQDGEPPFAARRVRRNLIIGTIDRFAPQPGRLDYNSSGWEAVCRAALRGKASLDGRKNDGACNRVVYTDGCADRGKEGNRPVIATTDTHATKPPSDNRDVLITGRVGDLGAVEIMAWWDGEVWNGTHGERISSVESWREME